MDKKSTVKFIVNYLIAIIIGNIIVYMVDRLGVKLGQPPMSFGKYIFVNLVVIAIGIFIALSTNKKQDKAIK